MHFNKKHSPKEEFEKALVVINRVKQVMKKEYVEKRVIIEKIIREKMQK